MPAASPATSDSAAGQHQARQTATTRTAFALTARPTEPAVPPGTPVAALHNPPRQWPAAPAEGRAQASSQWPGDRTEERKQGARQHTMPRVGPTGDRQSGTPQQRRQTRRWLRPAAARSREHPARERKRVRRAAAYRTRNRGTASCRAKFEWRRPSHSLPLPRECEDGIVLRRAAPQTGIPSTSVACEASSCGPGQ